MLNFDEILEFTIMLLIENRSLKDDKFSSYVSKHCNVETFNNRYKKLLDKFLTIYALNTTEKSD